MNPLLLVIIIISVVEILGLFYLYLIFKKGFQRHNPDEVIYDHLGITSGDPISVSGVEYMTYKGVWDKSVKTYDNCTFVETFSPYYDFFIHEQDNGGVILLRREK